MRLWGRKLLSPWREEWFINCSTPARRNKQYSKATKTLFAKMKHGYCKKQNNVDLFQCISFSAFPLMILALPLFSSVFFVSRKVVVFS